MNGVLKVAARPLITILLTITGSQMFSLGRTDVHANHVTDIGDGPDIQSDISERPPLALSIAL